MKKFLKKFLKLLAILKLSSRYSVQPINLGKVKNTLGIDADFSLNLGSGPNPRNPFLANHVYGVDIRSYDINENVKKCSLGTQKIPFEDNTFNVATAFDVLEHIPRVLLSDSLTIFPFVETMNEIWRVLKLNGVFYSETPCYPKKEAFQDPTHVNIMTEDTLRLYFTDKAWARIYGFKGSFRLIAEGWRGSHYYCLLQKSCEIPIDDLNSPQQ